MPGGSFRLLDMLPESDPLGERGADIPEGRQGGLAHIGRGADLLHGAGPLDIGFVPHRRGNRLERILALDIARMGRGSARFARGIGNGGKSGGLALGNEPMRKVKALRAARR